MDYPFSIGQKIRPEIDFIQIEGMSELIFVTFFERLGLNTTLVLIAQIVL